jgi:PAS domain S-box-containing protein
MDQINILIVEDEEFIALEIASRLERLGYTVCKNATNAPDAIEEVKKCKPDIILMDIRIKGDVDGIELAKNIRATQKIPIIYITAFSDPHTLNRAKETLPYGYLTKPISDKDLRITLELATHRIITERELEQTQNLLKKTERKYQLIAEHSSDLIYVYNLKPKPHYEYISPSFLLLTGYTPEEGYKNPNFYHEHLVKPDDVERFTNYLFAVPPPGEPLVEQWKRKDGRLIWVEQVVTCSYDNAGNLVSFQGTVRDITRRVKADERLRESRERFRSLYHNSTIGLYRTTPGGKILMANPALVKMLGYESFNQIKEIDLTKYGYAEPSKRDEFLRLLEEQNEITGFENQWLCKDGTTIFVREGAKATKDNKDSIKYIDGTIEDITEQKQALQALSESEERYRRITKGITDYLYSVKLENGITTQTIHNEACFAITGFTPQEFSIDSNLWLKIVFPDDRRMVLDKYQRFINGENLPTIEHRIVRKDGQVRWIKNTLIPKYNQDGTLISYDGVIRDITERKQAEQALRESEVRVRTKLDAVLSPEGDIGKLELADIMDVPEIQSLMDEFYNLTNIGVAIIDLRGEVLVHTGWQDICTKYHRVHPKTKKNCIESDTILSQGIAPGCFKAYKCKNNMWDISTPITVGGKHLGNIYLGQFVYNDEEVDYECFRQQAKRYGFAEQEYIDALNRIPRWSKETIDRAMKFYASLSQILSNLGYSSIKLARALEEHKQTEIALKESEVKYRTVANYTYDWEYWLHDGNIRYISPSVERITGYTHQEFISDPSLFGKIVYNEDAKVWLNHICTREINSEPSEAEFRIIRKDGEVRWIEHICRYIIDESGQNLGLRVSNRDITQQKELERQLITNTIDVEESERNRYSRELHDGLGPLLATIKLYFQWLSETDDTEKIRMLAEKGVANIDRAIETTREVSRGLSPLHIRNDGFVKALQNFMDDINSINKLSISFTSNINIRFNSTLEIMLYRIATELLNNTLKYAKATQVEIICNHLPEKNIIELSYTDNGKGFDAARVTRTSKGLGLPNIQSRAKAFGGVFYIESGKDMGIKVLIALPFAEN